MTNRDNKAVPASSNLQATSLQGDLDTDESASITQQEDIVSTKNTTLTKEINGPKGLEPTRYGDWESKGRCYDF